MRCFGLQAGWSKIVAKADVEREMLYLLKCFMIELNDLIPCIKR